MTKAAQAAQRKRDAAVYREAADVIASGKGEFSCNEIQAASAFEIDARIYSEFFEPSQVWHEPEDDKQGIRVLMLCFMAAMVEAGDA